MVIGGSGYIGSHACKELLRCGYKAVNLDNLSRGRREFSNIATFHEGDLGDPEALDRVFRTHNIEVVMHFAAFAYVGESTAEPAIYYENNVQKPLVLLEKMREFGVNNFIFSSTCATYGDVPSSDMPIREETPQNPINPYGRSKYFFEQILADYGRSYGLRHLSFRYFNAAGCDPEGDIGEWHDPETHLIPLALQAALGVGPELTVFGDDYRIPDRPEGDGTAVRDYIHVLDLVQAHILGMERMLETGESDVFNLGNGRGFSVMEVIRTVEKVTGKKVPHRMGPRRAGDPPILVGSAEKATKTLGWSPKFARLEDIVETAWRWELKRWESKRR